MLKLLNQCQGWANHYLYGGPRFQVLLVGGLQVSFCIDTIRYQKLNASSFSLYIQFLIANKNRSEFGDKSVATAFKVCEFYVRRN